MQKHVNYAAKYYHTKVFKPRGFNSKLDLNETVTFVLNIEVPLDSFRNKSTLSIIKAIQVDAYIEASL